jgi:adenylosuccinate lyase
VSVGKVSGAVGIHAITSPDLEKRVCEILGLRPDEASTQIINRDRHAAFLNALALMGAGLERIATELRNLQRTEILEVQEAFAAGQTGSSAMPHKRNPELTENATGLARMLRAWAQSSLENIALWHERDISHSSVERFIAPDMTVTLDFLLARVTTVVKDLQVYPKSMQRNLDLTRGLVYSATILPALADKGMAREDAYTLVQKHAFDTWSEIDAGMPGKTFAERVKEDPKVKALLSPAELDEIFSIKRHVANVDFIFNRVFGSAS